MEMIFVFSQGNIGSTNRGQRIWYIFPSFKGSSTPTSPAQFVKTFFGIDRQLTVSRKCKMKIAKKSRYIRNNRPEMFCKEVVLKNFVKFRGKYLCQSFSLIMLQALGLNFAFCEFCETFKNTYFVEHLRAAASYKLQPALTISYLSTQEAYSEPSKTSKMGLFAKQLTAFNKKLYLRYLNLSDLLKSLKLLKF